MSWLFSLNAEQAMSLKRRDFSKYFFLNQNTTQITRWLSDDMIYPRLKERDELYNIELLVTLVQFTGASS